MKYLFYLISFVFFANTILAQNSVQADQRLYDCFPEDYIKQLEKNNPQLIRYYNFFLENSFQIVDYSTEKPSKGKVIYDYAKNNIKTIDIDNFNPFMFNLDLDYEHYTHYLIPDKKKVIVFYPKKRIEKDYKNSLSK